eukprot:10566461-Alexandrium_andersonii.AAC.1
MALSPSKPRPSVAFSSTSGKTQAGTASPGLAVTSCAPSSRPAGRALSCARSLTSATARSRQQWRRLPAPGPGARAPVLH